MILPKVHIMAPQEHGTEGRVSRMAEYIERRKVSNACYAVFEDVVKHPRRLTAEEVRQTLLRFEKAINSVPAADVAPVRHGRWVFDGSDFADIWKCTACGEDWYFEYDPRDAETLVNYCPDCGAKMDLEGGDG
jgi:hypothetical protein